MSSLPEHLLQAICYLEFWKLSARLWGLHLNFGREGVEAQLAVKPKKAGR